MPQQPGTRYRPRAHRTSRQRAALGFVPWSKRARLAAIAAAERARLVAEFIARHGVTRCPCRYVPLP